VVSPEEGEMPLMDRLDVGRLGRVATLPG
jgi:hypothetical protein